MIDSRCSGHVFELGPKSSICYNVVTLTDFCHLGLRLSSNLAFTLRFVRSFDILHRIVSVLLSFLRKLSLSGSFPFFPPCPFPDFFAFPFPGDGIDFH